MVRPSSWRPAVATCARPDRRQRGFTLIEMVMVIVLLGILSAVLIVFIVTPFQAARDIERRADLVDAADLALNRISRELRGALPNSVRVHGTRHIEFIGTVTGGRYRRLPEPGGGSDIFVPARSSDSFDVLGGLMDAGLVVTRAPGFDCGTAAGHCLSVYNTGQPGFNAYAGQNLAAITAAGSNSISYDRGASGPAFATHSPQQRFFVTDSVVSYICDPASRQLRRHVGYGLGEGTPSLPTNGGELVVDQVADCQFSYTPGTATRRGLVSLRLDLENEGERVFLLVQAQVLNTP
ncbi:MAG: type II secretion system protein [Wenzhouxiangella sp.]|nr:MAG: type II secretion system protein [Wenzhouxiangella sp.]